MGALAPAAVVVIGRKAEVAGGANDTCVVLGMGVFLKDSQTSVAEDVDGSTPWPPNVAMACSKTLAKLTGAFGGGAYEYWPPSPSFAIAAPVDRLLFSPFRSSSSSGIIGRVGKLDGPVVVVTGGRWNTDGGVSEAASLVLRSPCGGVRASSRRVVNPASERTCSAICCTTSSSSAEKVAVTLVAIFFFKDATTTQRYELDIN